MSSLGNRPRIFISAAEPSADAHGAALIRATREVCPNVRFVGVAGPRMLAVGCEPIFDMTRHAAMLLGAVRAFGQGIAMLRTCDEHLRRYPFDAAVVIDSPVLHLPLAARAHAVGVPVFYYIAPQMWAWGAYRIYKLRHNVTRVAVILPFEEEFFRNQGVDATFVGHPIADQQAAATIDRGIVSAIRSRGNPVIALLPGSRRHVVETMLPGQLAVAERIAEQIPGAVFGVSVANPQVASVVEELSAQCPAGAKPHPERHLELIQAADLVLVTSGTTTLEVAFHQRPMIVMYNTSRLFYNLVGRWLIKTPHLSLPNILARRRIVPEFMPYYKSIEPIAREAVRLLRSDAEREKMLQELSKIVEPLRPEGASRRTAALLLDMIERSRH